MNILLSSTKTLDPEILDNLSRLSDTSIYLSLSQEYSQRIINEVNPEIVIINAENSGQSFATQVCGSHPGMEVYLYNASHAQNRQLLCCNSEMNLKALKLAAILPAFISPHKARKNPSQ